MAEGNSTTGQELHRKYRPTLFKEVVGQEAAVKVLTKFLKEGKVPQAILFSGASGCGKTTLARILRFKLGCGDADYDEVNAADARGIDDVRSIAKRSRLKPMAGKCRVWVIDEAHRLTGDAADATLKMLEDPPAAAYFFLCTTAPEKLPRTLITRCTQVRVAPLAADASVSLVRAVAAREKVNVPDTVVDKIAEAADGSARQCLNLLNQVLGLANEEEQLAVIEKGNLEKHAIDLCRCIINRRNKWTEVSRVLKELEEDPEKVRRAVLNYAAKVVQGGGPDAPRAYIVLEEFEKNFYDSGRAGLVRACFGVFHSK